MGFKKGHTITKVHGYAKSGKRPRIYNIWRSIKQRTSSVTNKDYYKYGGRGIKVCERWDDFNNFLEDMGEPPSDKHSIDRIDNNGDYTPENCRWATAKEQGRNRRSSAYLTALGKTKLIVEWAEELGWKTYTIRNRLRQNWDPDKIVTIPIKKHK